MLLKARYVWIVLIATCMQKELETLNHTDVQSNPGDTVEEQLRFELKGKDEVTGRDPDLQLPHILIPGFNATAE